MMKSLRFASVTVLTLLLAAPLAAQDWKGRGRLQGKVVDPDGNPYAGAVVKLHLPGDPESGPEPLTTDKKGRWSYLGLRGGEWTIVIDTDEYLISEGTLKVNEFGGPGQPIEIKLKKPSPEQLQSQAAGLVDEGNAHLSAGRYAEARAKYEEALETIAEGDRPSLLRGVAQTYIQEGENEKALAKLEETLALVPDDPTTLKLVISVLLAEGRDADARPYIDRLPAEEKLDSATRLNMGIEHYNAGELDAALEQFERAISDYPDDPDGYYYRGLTHLGLAAQAETPEAHNAQARADLEKFLAMAPESPRAAEAKSFLEYLESL